MIMHRVGRRGGGRDEGVLGILKDYVATGIYIYI